MVLFNWGQNEISKIIQPSTLYHNVNDRNIIAFIISK
jgi:hypothetical protein